jgi:poly-gamma-glutamate synthesis protein (capsule biosynthesis protein)
MPRLAFMGDVMLGRNVNLAVAEKGPAYPWGNTLSLLKEADLRIINLECVISDKKTPWTKTEKVFHFRADPHAVDVLKAAKIDYVSLANNHTLDYNEDAMLDMIRRLDQAGIKHAGAGRNLNEASKPAILEAGGIKIAIISITDNVPEWEAAENAPGVNFVPTWPTTDNIPHGKNLRDANRALPFLGRLAAPILTELVIWPKMAAAAKKLTANTKGTDLIICSSHLGPNWCRRPSRLFRRFTHRLADLGVDVYHGHSAHVFQEIEIYKGRPILFDTGDFVDDYAVYELLRNDFSFIFMLDIGQKSKKPEKLTLVPTYISDCQVNLAPPDLADAICRRMENLCSAAGTETKRDGNNLVIELA